MNSYEFVNKIKEDYAVLFANDVELCIPKGWQTLISCTLECLMRYNSSPININTIKSKFGSLRIYCETKERQVLAVLDMAEFFSTKVCETCGNVGTINNFNGMVRNLCQVHTREASGHFNMLR